MTSPPVNSNTIEIEKRERNWEYRGKSKREERREKSENREISNGARYSLHIICIF